MLIILSLSFVIKRRRNVIQYQQGQTWRLAGNWPSTIPVITLRVQYGRQIQYNTTIDWRLGRPRPRGWRQLFTSSIRAITTFGSMAWGAAKSTPALQQADYSYDRGNLDGTSPGTSRSTLCGTLVTKDTPRIVWEMRIRQLQETGKEWTMAFIDGSDLDGKAAGRWNPTKLGTST